VIEDAVRPSEGWLETAMDAIEKVMARKWQGHVVGALGLASSFDHWELAVAGLIPGALADYFGRVSHETARDFWRDGWNDGLICWPRLLPKITEACASTKAASWPAIIQDTWRRPILSGKFLDDVNPTDWQHRVTKDRWPQTRKAWPDTIARAWGLVNMDAWHKVGRYRDGCCFFEGHLAVRLAQAGYLCVNIHNPPWLHFPSMAFHAAAAEMGKTPRHNLPDRGLDGPFQHDFGIEPDSIHEMAAQQFRPGEMEAIAEEMAAVELRADPAWHKWMGEK
jgi:hypothetical protein